MKIAVVGTGLIGSSLGLAARARLGATVVGVDPDPAPALDIGAISAVASLESALAGADAAFVATPVAALPATVAEVLRAAPPSCVVSDTGSVKREVVAAIDDERFVGGHPLAGAESAGARAAREDLFEGATWYLTPTTRSSGMQLERLHRMLGRLGAHPAVLDAETHDRLMAAVSHLPHMTANALVGQAARVTGTEAAVGWGAAGPSFRDATRVAGANPELWAQIYAANRDALLAALDGALGELGEVRERLAAGEDLRALAVGRGARPRGAAGRRRRRPDRAARRGPQPPRRDRRRRADAVARGDQHRGHVARAVARHGDRGARAVGARGRAIRARELLAELGLRA